MQLSHYLFQKAKQVAITTSVIVFAASSPIAFAKKTQLAHPNILFILSDNQAPSTIGVYGNHNIKTPNIDKLAKQGILFQNAYACNGMSSPSRACIMTGLMPSQTGVQTWLDDSLQKTWPKNWSAIGEFRTLSQTLSDNGYDTALIGKWHLGNPYKPQLKFKYWLTFPFGDTRSFYNNEIIDNGKTYINHGHITDFWTKKAVEYIKNRKNEKKPFFLYLAYDAPYGIPPAITGKPKNRFGKLYENDPMKSFPRLPMNPLFVNFVIVTQHFTNILIRRRGIELAETLNNIESMRNYASQITLVDDGIGQVLKALQQSGLEKNTLVIFSSDQGLAYGQKGLWGQSINTFPSNLYESEIRIPLIFKQPDKIKPGQTSAVLFGQYDLFPTLLDYIGMGDIKIKNTPGISFASILKGRKMPLKNNRAIFFEQEETRGMRTKNWVYIKRFHKQVFYKQFEELYNINEDPEEMNNLADNPKYIQLKRQLNDILDIFYKEYSDPKYNLWEGGTAKSNISFPPFWTDLTPKWHTITPVSFPFE